MEGDGVTAEDVNITFTLELVTGRTSGVTAVKDSMTQSTVNLSSSTGSGTAEYNITGMDDTLDGEWVILPVDFKWTSGDLIDMGEVDVSLDPVSTRGDANFDDENVQTPAFRCKQQPHDDHLGQPLQDDAALPVCDRNGRLLYRNRRYEYFGAKWHLRRHFRRGQSTY